MKKFIVGGLLIALLATGCRSIDYEEESYDRESMCLQMKADQIAHVDDNDWEDFLSQISEVESSEDYNYRVGRREYDDYLAQRGIIEYNGIYYYENLASQKNTQYLEILGTKMGEDLSGYIDKSSTLERGEDIQHMSGGYALLMNNEYDRVETYIIKSNLVLNDESKMQWLDEICGDEMMLSAVSKGEEKQLYELSSPSFIANDSYGYQGDIPLTNLQIFTENSGKVDKVRLVIIQNGHYYNADKDNFKATTLAPLIRFINSMKGNVDCEELVDQVMAACSGQRSKVKGDVDNTAYQITRTAKSNGKNVIEIVMTF